jgi:predicted nuclease of predicted toxin-antitoxin system
VRLLFDESLSPKLTYLLTQEYPSSEHVRDAGLLGATDRQIWDYARAHGFAVVSKDTDFRERSYVEGAPPKVIWLDIGNTGTAAIAYLFREERRRVLAFEASSESSLLILSIGPRTV